MINDIEFDTFNQNLLVNKEKKISMEKYLHHFH